MSTCEAEYIAVAESVKEAKFFEQLFVAFNVPQVSMNAVLINVDNPCAMKLAKNAMLHKQSKHIDVTYHHYARNVDMSNTMA